MGQDEPLWGGGGMDGGEPYLGGGGEVQDGEYRGCQNKKVDEPTRLDRFPRLSRAERWPAANSRSSGPASSPRT